MKARPSQCMRCPTAGGLAISFAVLAFASTLGACSVLPSAAIAVDSASRSDLSSVARISIDPARPVLLHAVDEKFLSSIQVSNYLRPVTFIVRPGAHDLWLSESPAGIPFLPQHINCFVMQVTVAAGSRYHLELDRKSRLPILRRIGAVDPEAIGVLVDRAFLLLRGCKWQ